jgi:hypothetical protein
MNDELTKDAKADAKKRRQEIGFFVVMIGVFVFSSYSLFEAVWMKDVLNCGKRVGCYWNSYQDSPIMFFVGTLINVCLFLLSSYVIIEFVRRKMAEK